MSEESRDAICFIGLFVTICFVCFTVRSCAVEHKCVEAKGLPSCGELK